MSDPASLTTLLDLGNTGFIIIAVIYLLREINKRDELWRGFIREQNQEIQQITEQSSQALAEIAQQVERLTAVVLMSSNPANDEERIALVRRMFEL